MEQLPYSTLVPGEVAQADRTRELLTWAKRQAIHMLQIRGTYAYGKPFRLTKTKIYEQMRITLTNINLLDTFYTSSYMYFTENKQSHSAK